MAERNEIQCPENFGIEIRNRLLGLNLYIKKLDEKITQLVMVTGALKEETVLSSSTIGLLMWKKELEDVNKRAHEILIQYPDACNKNREKEEEEEENVMKELKALIIEVYKIKHNIDKKIQGLHVVDHVEGESSQDLRAKQGSKDHDRKGKDFIIDDSDVMKFGHEQYGESSQAISLTEMRNDEFIEGESSQDLSGKLGKDEDHDQKGKGFIIEDSDDDDLMEFDHGAYGDSNQARALTETRKDEFLTLSSSTEEEISTAEPKQKDRDVKEIFLNKDSEAFELSETSQNDNVEQQASDSDDDDATEVYSGQHGENSQARYFTKAGVKIIENYFTKVGHGQYRQSSQARSFTEMRKDKEILTYETEKKDGDAKESFLNKTSDSEAIELSETPKNDDVEQQAFDSEPEDYVGTLGNWAKI